LVFSVELGTRGDTHFSFGQNGSKPLGNDNRKAASRIDVEDASLG